MSKELLFVEELRTSHEGSEVEMVCKSGAIVRGTLMISYEGCGERCWQVETDDGEYFDFTYKDVLRIISNE
jgi:hypothetical protein